MTLFLCFKKCDYMRVDGSTPSEKRQSEVSRFQENSSCRVALLSITAANMGINLHAASLVVFAELFWNPGVSFFFFWNLCCRKSKNFFVFTIYILIWSIIMHCFCSMLICYCFYYLFAYK